MRLSVAAAIAALALGTGDGVRAESEVGAAGDGSITGSVSCGRANRGSLAHASRMPTSGTGFIIVEPWLSRELSFGTDELVAAVQRAALAVAEKYDGSLLAVGDLSERDGGAVSGHRSHQSGRDVDLIYYALDEAGDPLPPDRHMAYYRSSGRADYARNPKWTKDIRVRYFDMARNWALVKALATDSEFPVSRIFVSHRVKRWLLDYAKAAGESPDTIATVRAVLKRPSDSKAHNDHMHVRIGCSTEDQGLGTCRDKLARKSRGSKWRRNVPCPVSDPAPPRS